MCDALARALAALPSADRLILQLRYWSGHTVARIAVLTGADQKALYRRFDKLSADLRRRLEAEGLSGHALAAVTGRFSDANDESSTEPAEVLTGNLSVGPSTVTTGGEHG